MNDNTIIRLIQDGKIDAYARLVQKYHKNLLSFIYRLVRDPNITEDIGQEVFLSAYKSLAGFNTEKGTPFSAWLFVIARNKCVNYLRDHKNVKTLPVDELKTLSLHHDNAEEALIKQEDLQILTTSLRQLPEPFRSTILKSLEGASMDQIACEFGIPLSTVKTRLLRARAKIKKLMNIYVGGVGHERKI
ncbi:MAG: sigma-70 family RNA polymerase sigma factor [Desulfatiglans sp.]|jgi:RNA polymerase sigma-70 factor (ECF subfamily)|nr:sigma-70 family RNA polymerase sigma factor [Desulfatiglans sp.]